MLLCALLISGLPARLGLSLLFLFRLANTAHETALVFVHSEGRYISKLNAKSHEAFLEVLRADKVEDWSAVVKWTGPKAAFVNSPNLVGFHRIINHVQDLRSIGADLRSLGKVYYWRYQESPKHVESTQPEYASRTLSIVVRNTKRTFPEVYSTAAILAWIFYCKNPHILVERMVARALKFKCRKSRPAPEWIKSGEKLPFWSETKSTLLGLLGRRGGRSQSHEFNSVELPLRTRFFVQIEYLSGRGRDGNRIVSLARLVMFCIIT